eukprot:3718109-Prymnesium_polylepis.1
MRGAHMHSARPLLRASSSPPPTSRLPPNASSPITTTLRFISHPIWHPRLWRLRLSQANLASEVEHPVTSTAGAPAASPVWSPEPRWVRARRDTWGVHLTSLAACVTLELATHATGATSDYSFDGLGLLLSHQLSRTCLAELKAAPRGSVALADLELIGLTPTRLSTQLLGFTTNGAATLDKADLEH